MAKIRRKILNRVLEVRTAKKVSQNELAKKLEISRLSVKSIERGKYIPPLQLAFDMAEELDVGVEELFFREKKALTLLEQSKRQSNK